MNTSAVCDKILEIAESLIQTQGYNAFSYRDIAKAVVSQHLAVDVLTLPEAIQKEVKLFFKNIEQWLEQFLLSGKKVGKFHFKGEAREEAQFILSLLEGTLLLARLYQDEGRFDGAMKRLKTTLL